MDRPSILLVTTVPITLEAFLAPFAVHFRAAGWRVDALSSGASGDPRIAEAFDARYDVAWSRDPLDPRNLAASATVRRVVRAGAYDIVHVHTPIAAFVTRRALRSLNGAQRPVVIYTAHGFHFHEGGRFLANLLYRWLERRAAPWTDYLVAVNSEDERAARALGGIAPERVRLIHGIGVDVDRFAAGAVTASEAAAVRRKLDVPDDAFVLAMVAEFAAVKRHAHVLRALARVRDSRVVLVLAGDGPLEARVRGLVNGLGLAQRVRFAGYRRDVPAVLAASDALVIASDREGLNRAALEAMAAGRPVIGTDTRGIADAVQADAGWIVEKHDVDALARAIENAAGDPVEVARRGAAARSRAEREYALPRVIAEYEELYREALSTRV